MLNKEEILSHLQDMVDNVTATDCQRETWQNAIDLINTLEMQLPGVGALVIPASLNTGELQEISDDIVSLYDSATVKDKKHIIGLARKASLIEIANADMRGLCQAMFDPENQPPQYTSEQAWERYKILQQRAKAVV